MAAAAAVVAAAVPALAMAEETLSGEEKELIFGLTDYLPLWVIIPVWSYYVYFVITQYRPW